MPPRRLAVCLALLLAGPLLADRSAGATPAPTVTIGRPASGALLSQGQPSFAGSASDGATDTGRVTVDVYAGSSPGPGAVPREVLQTTVTGGQWTVAGVGLADGTYTAVASEPDRSGQIGQSQPVTFQLYNGGPELTLQGPASPVQTTTPTFTGAARTEPGDASRVQLEVYPGTGTDATPVAVLSGTVAADGSFSIQVLPGLARGTYTVVAAQQLVTHEAYSAPVTVQIAAGRAALSLGAPAAGASEPQTGLVFSGDAGHDYGDGPTVVLTLYRGRVAAGPPVGSETVQRVGAGWRERWPVTLALGSYTVVVTQTNVAGAVTRITRTFDVVAPGTLTGPVAISAAGAVTAHLRCVSGAGTCVGDVLVLTQRAFTPVPGGPRGPLSLMFAHFSVPAGQVATLGSQLSGPVLTALRRAGTVDVMATVAYPVDGRLRQISQRIRAVHVGG